MWLLNLKLKSIVVNLKLTNAQHTMAKYKSVSNNSSLIKRRNTNMSDEKITKTKLKHGMSNTMPCNNQRFRLNILYLKSIA